MSATCVLAAPVERGEQRNAWPSRLEEESFVSPAGAVLVVRAFGSIRLHRAPSIHVCAFRGGALSRTTIRLPSIPTTASQGTNVCGF